MQRSSNVPFDRAGSSPALAHAQHWGRERRVLSACQPGATVLRGSAVAGREPQPGMDRMLHGISARLDRARWPDPPGPQFGVTRLFGVKHTLRANAAYRGHSV